MSTRSVIARPAGDGWEGRYCHFDGSPDHQGPALFEAVTHEFAGDVAAAQRYFIDDHPAGWSVIGHTRIPPDGHRPNAPDDADHCYCHEGDFDRPAPLITDQGDHWNTAYAYVLAPGALQVMVRDRGWWPLLEAAWDGPPPNWHVLPLR